MNLLGALGISHAVLHDDDHQRQWNAEINELIVDSRNDFTLEVQSLSGDLEDVLGIPKADSPHRKPQHVLYQYEIGAIDDENLIAFCETLYSMPWYTRRQRRSWHCPPQRRRNDRDPA